VSAPRSTGGTKGGPSYRHPAIRVSRYTSGLPKVILLHDHAFVSESLKLLLADRVDIVAQTPSGKAAVALSELLVPDVVVAGEILIDGVVEHFATPLLQTGTRLLLITQPQDTARLLDLVGLGVTGLVDTDQSPSDLAEAVLVLAAGGAVLPADVVAAVATDWRRYRRKGTNGAQIGELTSRELEVLGAMSDGLSTKAAAHHLGIAAKTVENHKTRIFHKLGIRTQAQAVALAIGNEAYRPEDAARSRR
jgi:DNA-binding NarL/FixJ family response regulator